MRRNRDASKVSVFSPGPIGTVPTYFRNHRTSKSDSLLLLQMAFGGKFCVSPWLSRYVVVMQEHLQRALLDDMTLTIDHQKSMFITKDIGSQKVQRPTKKLDRFISGSD